MVLFIYFRDVDMIKESKEPTVTKESLEERIGGAWLNCLGIVALLVGLELAFAELGYASRYSLDLNHGRLWFYSGGYRVVAQISTYQVALNLFASGHGGQGNPV